MKCANHMSSMSKDLVDRLSLQYNFVFQESRLLEQALTHKSYKNETPSCSYGDNERLEFLGDAVLDLALSAELMERHPQSNEGSLSKMRASLVNEMALAEVAKELHLDKELRLGKGERNSGGATKPRLLASAFEALLGAIFIDSDYTTANRVIRQMFRERIEKLDLDTQYHDDYKTRLQEKIQASGTADSRSAPRYEIEREEGPDHEKVFHVVLQVGSAVLARGQGRSKKQAEQEAARLALEALR